MAAERCEVDTVPQQLTAVMLERLSQLQYCKKFSSVNMSLLVDESNGHCTTKITSHTAGGSDGSHSPTQVMESSSPPVSASSSSSTSPSYASSVHADQQNGYKSMYSSPKKPDGLVQILWLKIEAVFIYLWVFIQVMFLVAGLTVLHFSMFSTVVVYIVNGLIKGRREFKSH